MYAWQQGVGKALRGKGIVGTHGDEWGKGMVLREKT